jgi:hypothetical protein
LAQFHHTAWIADVAARIKRRGEGSIFDAEPQATLFQRAFVGKTANLHPPATAGGTDPALHSTYLGVPIIVIPDFSQTIVTKSQPERVEKKNFFLVMCRFHEFGKIHLFLLTKRFYD